MVGVLDMLNAMWSLMTGCVLFVQGPVIARWNLVFMSLAVIEVGIGLLMIEDVWNVAKLTRVVVNIDKRWTWYVEG